MTILIKIITLEILAIVCLFICVVIIKKLLPACIPLPVESLNIEKMSKIITIIVGITAFLVLIYCAIEYMLRIISTVSP